MTPTGEVVRRLAEAAARGAVADPETRRLARELKALPIISDPGGCYLLTEDLSVIAVEWADPTRRREEDDARTKNSVLYRAAKKYPQLAQLSPARPDDAAPCPSCGGSGKPSLALHERFGEDAVVCYCGGLGWIPASDAAAR